MAQRALMVLAVLVEHAGEVVSRDELFDAVWRDRLVEPGNLDVQLSVLRGLLGRELIQTVPGRGYRIAVRVTVGGAPLNVRDNPTESELAAPEKTNLPRYLAPLIGRDGELAELAGRIAEQRLVTISGPGGVGKTRLAITVGQRRYEGFPDGVWLIDLAALTDPALIVSATATALGVVLRDAERPIEVIVRALAQKHLLLIFDNCEYLVAPAAALIQTLLGQVPGLSVLVTSQEVLRLSAEMIYRLDPLALPPETGDGEPKIDQIAGYGAVELFVARARAADRRFRFDAGNAPLIAAICRGLEGLPLALEMAAARLTVLGINGLHQRLGARLDMLAARASAGGARHQTLLAMVEWSHGLLDAPERQVFRRLALFRGGFCLDAAIAVAGADETDPWAAADTLQRLIDKSLVTVEPGNPPRYRLLETLRLFAGQKLAASDESEAVAERHARHFIGLFDDADMARQEASDAEWRLIYLPEIDNVRAALQWAFARPERRQIAVALAAVTAVLWHARDLYAEGRHYFDRAESLIDADTPDDYQALLLSWGGAFWYGQDLPRALALAERSATIHRGLDQPFRLAWALTQAGYAYTVEGRYPEARAALCEAKELLSKSSYKKALSVILSHLGLLATYTDDTGEARRCFSRAIELSRAANDTRLESYCLIYLAELEFRIGAVDVAVDRVRQAVGAVRSTQYRTILGWASGNLAAYLVAQGNLAEARPFATEALWLVREHGGKIVLDRLQLWALLGAAEGRYDDAARLAGYVEAGYIACAERRTTTELYLHDQLSKFLDDNLSAAAIQSNAAEGARWTEDQAVDFVYARILARG